MTPQWIVAGALSLAVFASWARLVLAWRSGDGGGRAWRRAVLFLVQPALAVLLYLVLYPPRMDAAGGPAVPVVLAEGADARLAAEASGPLFALPEAPDIDGAERVPDLATVLRRHPGVRRVRVIGTGLPARDLDAARGVAVELAPFEPPPGLWRVQVAPPVVAGGLLRVSGQAGGVPGGQVELLDPAGRRVDAAAPAGDGSFALSALAYAPGAADYTLRVLDAEGGLVETASLPVWVEPSLAPRVLLLAGAPNPETRALSRWMQDAGFEVQSRIALGGGAALAAGTATSDYARHDLLVVDARAWDGLGEGGRARVLRAVEAGMGLLLRVDTPLPARALRPLSGQGFAIAGGAGIAPLRLPAPRLADEAALRARLGTGSADAPADIKAAAEAVPELARRDLRVGGGNAVPLLRDAGGDAVAWWRAHGQGRIGVWTPVDTWLLPQAGRRDLYADLWNAAVTTLARARPQPAIHVPDQAREGGRVAVCGIGDGAVVIAPDGTRARLLPDPEAGGCAAYWPSAAGWHRVADGDAGRPFHVSARDVMPVARLVAMREATLRTAAMAAGDGNAGATVSASARRMSPWPWFLAWLLLAAATWWLERSRAGRAPSTPGPA